MILEGEKGEVRLSSSWCVREMEMSHGKNRDFYKLSHPCSAWKNYVLMMFASVVFLMIGFYMMISKVAK